MMWQLYRPEQVRFVGTLVLQTLGVSVSPRRLSWVSEVIHGVLAS